MTSRCWSSGGGRRPAESLKDVVNAALRQGLKEMVATPRRRVPFRTRNVDLGRCLPGSLDNVAEVLSIAEGESFR